MFWLLRSNTAESMRVGRSRIESDWDDIPFHLDNQVTAHIGLVRLSHAG